MIPSSILDYAHKTFWMALYLLSVSVLMAQASRAETSLAIKPGEALPGAHLQRTMTLLATSTPRRRNPVRILFYGQSITKQEWSQAVAEDLRRRFPSADLTVENRAIGGFASDLLVRTAERDVDTFYPDLVIFHDYGGEPNYEAIIVHIRRSTTAEIALCNDHLSTSQPLEWHDHHSNVWLPQIADKYGCQFVDIRTAWKQYLKDNGLGPEALTKDGLHLNDRGNRLMASLVERALSYNSAIPGASWDDMVTTKRVGLEGRWSHGKLVMPFDGNRVDLITTGTQNGTAQIKSGTAHILIDGKKTSEFSELYSYTRLNERPGADWPWETAGIL